MRARVELPKDGRWMSVDPLWPKFLAYVFSSSSPATVTDRDGLMPTTVYPNKSCYIKHCKVYGWNNNTVTHSYVCAQSPAKNCTGGLNPSQGVTPEWYPCVSTKRWPPHGKRQFPIVCETISEECGYAAFACACISHHIKTTPKDAWNLLNNCHRYVQTLLDCICDRLSGGERSLCIIKLNWVDRKRD